MTLKKLGINLVQRKGMHNIYDTPRGIIWVGKCTASYYESPGYYISTNSELGKKCFATSKAAIIEAVQA